MKNSEKARLQEIYDQIEDLKSELEDLVDGLGDDDDDDAEDALETAIEGLDTTINALDDLVDTGAVFHTLTAVKLAEVLTCIGISLLGSAVLGFKKCVCYIHKIRVIIGVGGLSVGPQIGINACDVVSEILRAVAVFSELLIEIVIKGQKYLIFSHSWLLLGFEELRVSVADFLGLAEGYLLPLVEPQHLR